MPGSTFANRSRAALLAFALALLALAASAATAGAVSGTVDLGEKPPGFSVQMVVPGSHGYQIEIGAEDHRTVTVTASKGDAIAIYSAPGRATSERLEANFGKFGRVSVRFIPSGGRGGRAAREGAERRCEIRGRFEGVIRFRGEQGYTQVNAKRAGGTITPDGNGRCSGKRANARLGLIEPLAKGSDLNLSFTALGAVARSGQRSVAFYDVDLFEAA
jgi:hypothetical protein